MLIDHKQISEKDLERINRYTRKDLSKDAIYVFSVVLCDNEIDRDFERFSDEALEELANLYIGVTGIADINVTDNNQKSKSQSVRIFSCNVESPEGRTTSDGKQYKRLYAKAYLLKGVGNNELILALKSGAKKEVSVGCAVRKRICSICGDDVSNCKHRKGRKYSGKLCYATLEEPTDAYEWALLFSLK